MPRKNKDYQKKDFNRIELDTIADLKAEGHGSFAEMTGPLRRRMADQTGQHTVPRPRLVKITVTTAALLMVGVFFLVRYSV